MVEELDTRGLSCPMPIVKLAKKMKELSPGDELVLIADDIGAILVIAIGYTESLNMTALALGGLGIAVLPLMIRVGIRSPGIYYALMVLTWLAFHESGVHATIAGVIFGLMMPARSWITESRLESIFSRTRHFLKGDGWRTSTERYAMLRQMERAARKSISPLERHETELHPWVGFLIMPVFALANAGVPIQASAFLDPVALATALGLVVGKPVGILLFSWLAVKFKLTRLPEGINWGVILGGGFLAGIGFTMALFISGLALSGPVLDAAKVDVKQPTLKAGFLVPPFHAIVSPILSVLDPIRTISNEGPVTDARPVAALG